MRTGIFYAFFEQLIDAKIGWVGGRGGEPVLELWTTKDGLATSCIVDNA